MQTILESGRTGPGLKVLRRADASASSGAYRSIPPMAMDRLAEVGAQLHPESARVYDFGKGVSSFNPFAHSSIGLTASDLERCLGYGEIKGLWALRAAIAQDYGERFGCDINPARVCMTTGATSALTLAFTLLLDGDSEVILPATHFPVYRVLADIVGAKVRLAPLNARRALDVERLPQLITSRTRAIVVNSPSNPFGAVSTDEELEAISRLGVPVLYDEVYQTLGLSDEPIPSAAPWVDRHILVNSFSKSMAAAGVRLGYLIVPEDQVEQATNLMAAVSMSTSLPSQWVGLALFQERARIWSAHREMLQQHWGIFQATAQRLGLQLCGVPRAGYFACVGISDLGMDPMTVALSLVRHAAVVTVPGNDFGGMASHFLRLSFACPREILEPGLERLAAALYNVRDGLGQSERSGLSWQGRQGMTVLSAL